MSHRIEAYAIPEVIFDTNAGEGVSEIIFLHAAQESGEKYGQWQSEVVRQ